MSTSDTSIPEKDQFDVVIVGAGVAGALIADTLWYGSQARSDSLDQIRF